jgi:hypothetical protein
VPGSVELFTDQTRRSEETNLLHIQFFIITSIYIAAVKAALALVLGPASDHRPNPAEEEETNLVLIQFFVVTSIYIAAIKAALALVPGPVELFTDQTRRSEETSLVIYSVFRHHFYLYRSH